MNITKLLKKHSTIGVCANRSRGKTMLILSMLKKLRRQHPQLNIAVMGINRELNPVLEKYNIKVLYNKMDILDLRLRDTVIFVDEMAMLFDSKGRSKQQDKLMRFFDRIEHNNCKIIMATAREGYFNKFMCGRISAFIVKEIEYDALVNGTWLNERVKSIESLSDYRLQMDISEYFIVDKGDSLTVKGISEYLPEFDTKKENIDLFCEKKVEQKGERKLEEKGFIKVLE